MTNNDERARTWTKAANEAMDAAKPLGLALMAVADAEQAELRAEVDRLRDDVRVLELHRDTAVSGHEGLRARVGRVAALHPRGVAWYDPGEGMVTTDDDRIDDACQSCSVPWPCPTIDALAGPAEPEATEG